MKQFLVLLLLIALPGTAFALEQSFTQQGLKATIKLSPEKLETQSEVQLSLSLSKDGTSVTDRDVTLEVFERDADQPIITHPVDVLDGDYVDSWKFDKKGDYKVVIEIVDRQKPDEIIRYEVNATVMDAGAQHGDHGFFAHHFGDGHWGWWGAGMMLIMMPIMILL